MGAIRPLSHCLGVSFHETPVVGLAVLTDSPKAEPWRASAHQGSVLGVADRFRTRSGLVIGSVAEDLT